MKIAIVGRAKTWVYAPFHDTGYFIWGVNDHPLNANFPSLDMLFELHDDALDADRYSNEYKEWLQKDHHFPVMMKHRDERVPNCRVLPDLNVHGLWHGDNEVQQLGMTVCYMIAYAIHRGFDHIGLYGVELSTKWEYTQHRGLVMYWIGRANAAGVTVEIPKQSELYEHKLYP